MNRNAMYLVLVLVGVLTVGCLGGSSPTSSISTYTVNGTIQYEGDLDDSFVTVGLNQYVQEIEMIQVAGQMALAESWEGSYSIRVPKGEYTLWVSGEGVSADTAQVTVTDRDVAPPVVQAISIPMKLSETFYQGGADPYAEIYIDDADDDWLAGAEFALWSSSLARSIPATLYYDVIEVDPSEVETGVYTFLEMKVDGRTHVFRVFFLPAPVASNFGHKGFYSLPYTLKWNPVLGATKYQFRTARSTLTGQPFGWNTNFGEYLSVPEFAPGLPGYGNIQLYAIKDVNGSRIATSLREYQDITLQAAN